MTPKINKAWARLAGLLADPSANSAQIKRASTAMATALANASGVYRMVRVSALNAAVKDLDNMQKLKSFVERVSFASARDKRAAPAVLLQLTGAAHRLLKGIK